MPTTNEGLDQVEAVVSSDNSTNNAASSAGSVSADPAPRRRRGGRRVVRGVGAAGASLELKVEEHAKAPLFEEPKLEPVQPARDSADFNDADPRPYTEFRLHLQSVLQAAYCLMHGRSSSDVPDPYLLTDTLQLL